MLGYGMPENSCSITEWNGDALKSSASLHARTRSGNEVDLFNNGQHSLDPYNSFSKQPSIIADAEPAGQIRFLNDNASYDRGIDPLLIRRHTSAETGLHSLSNFSTTPPQLARPHRTSLPTIPTIPPPNRPSLTLSPPNLVKPPRSRKTKQTHNIIEKKYRNALNDKFDTLRDQLSEKFRTDGSGRLCTKGDVLSSARTYIRELEEEGEDLKREKRKLKADVERLEGLWMEHLEDL